MHKFKRGKARKKGNKGTIKPATTEVKYYINLGRASMDLHR
jgi:hypothetical protein